MDNAIMLTFAYVLFSLGLCLILLYVVLGCFMPYKYSNRVYCEIFEHKSSVKWRELIARIGDFKYDYSLKDTVWVNDKGNGLGAHYFENENGNELVILWEKKEGGYTASLHTRSPHECVLADFDKYYSDKVVELLEPLLTDIKYKEDINITVRIESLSDEADFKEALQREDLKITDYMIDRLSTIDPTIENYDEEYVGKVYEFGWNGKKFYVEYCKNIDKWLLYTSIKNSDVVADFYKDLKCVLS